MLCSASRGEQTDRDRASLTEETTAVELIVADGLNSLHVGWKPSKPAEHATHMCQAVICARAQLLLWGGSSVVLLLLKADGVLLCC